MPSKKGKEKSSESTMVLDVYENWMAKQPVKPVKGKSGFIGTQKIEGTQ